MAWGKCWFWNARYDRFKETLNLSPIFEIGSVRFVTVFCFNLSRKEGKISFGQTEN